MMALPSALLSLWVNNPSPRTALLSSVLTSPGANGKPASHWGLWPL